MSEIKIDKGIKIPKVNSKYPFQKMDVGDSFFIEASNGSVSSCILYWQKKHPDKKFTQRKESNGYRVWRIK